MSDSADIQHSSRGNGILLNAFSCAHQDWLVILYTCLFSTQMRGVEKLFTIAISRKAAISTRLCSPLGVESGTFPQRPCGSQDGIPMGDWEGLQLLCATGLSEPAVGSWGWPAQFLSGNGPLGIPKEASNPPCCPGGNIAACQKKFKGCVTSNWRGRHLKKIKTYMEKTLNNLFG